MVYLIAFLVKSIFMIAAVAFIIFVLLLASFTILTIIVTFFAPFHTYWDVAISCVTFNPPDPGIAIIFWAAIIFILIIALVFAHARAVIPH